MIALTLTESNWSTVANALRYAANGYSENAYDCDRNNLPRLAEQFRKQRAEALRLADWISNEAGV